MTTYYDDPASRLAAIRDALAEQTARLPKVDHNGRPITEETK